MRSHSETDIVKDKEPGQLDSIELLLENYKLTKSNPVVNQGKGRKKTGRKKTRNEKRAGNLGNCVQRIKCWRKTILTSYLGTSKRQLPKSCLCPSSSVDLKTVNAEQEGADQEAIVGRKERKCTTNLIGK